VKTENIETNQILNVKYSNIITDTKINILNLCLQESFRFGLH